MAAPGVAALLLLPLLATSAWAATATDRCEAAKLLALGKHVRCQLKAIARGVRIGTPPDRSSCAPEMALRIARIDQRFAGACPVLADAGGLDALARRHVDAVAGRLAPSPLTGSAAACAAGKLIKTALLADCRARAEAAALENGLAPNPSSCEDKAKRAFDRASLLYGAACPTQNDAATTSAELARLTAEVRLNVVVVYLDDVRWDVMSHLPDGMAPNLERLADDGVVFTNAFAPTPVCAQSRATLLTGLRIRDGVRGGHGVTTLVDIASFQDGETLATWFAAQDRSAGLFGKYINGYKAPPFDVGNGRLYVPPGWSHWLAVRTNEWYGGLHGATWWAVHRDGTQTEQRGCCQRTGGTPPHCYVDDPACVDDQTYQSDVLAAALHDFVAGGPAPGSLAILTPSAAHTGFRVFPVPAARHYDLLLSLPTWRPASFALPIENQGPHTWNGVPLPVFPQPGLTDQMRRFGLESLLAVDEAIGELLDTLEETGRLDRTAIILTSDNGVAWGEHALWNQTKSCAYEECQRVPMIVRMPDGVGRVVEEPVLVTDLAPTIAALARVPVPLPTDGRSFEPILRGATPAAPWRTDYCLEYVAHTPSPIDYRGVRDVAGGFTYVEYSNGSLELFDLNLDPAQLQNVAGLPTYAADQARLAARLPNVCG